MPIDMFVAPSDPTQRANLELLASRGELSATDIYKQFSVSPQAISQHLKVLREAKLVVMEKRAQKHLYSLNPHTLSQFETWVRQTRQKNRSSRRVSKRRNENMNTIRRIP